MAHYAFLDKNNVVVDVICGRDEDDLPEGVTDWETFYGAERGMRCLRTSINTSGNRHANGKTPFRYNYAIIGGTYSDEKNGFIGPKPRGMCGGGGFHLDQETLTWVESEPHPDDGYCYRWDPLTDVWFRAGPDLPVPDTSKNWAYEPENGGWAEIPQAN
jgi:hypothetical protein